MIVKRGTFYACDVCECELVATRSPESCPSGDCGLSCCGKPMNKSA